MLCKKDFYQSPEKSYCSVARENVSPSEASHSGWYKKKTKEKRLIDVYEQGLELVIIFIIT